MASRYTISIMPKAAADIESTVEYISNELKNPTAATHLIEENATINRQIGRLST